jgi:hypothetical protein
MDEVWSQFRTRCQEIEHYIRTLRFIEESGTRIVSRDGSKYFPIDTTTQHVLKASVFLHLYNLVESTITACLTQVAKELHARNMKYTDITDGWRRSWLREVGQANDPLNPEKRLEAMLNVCDSVARGAVIEFEPLVGLNIDDQRIEKLTEQHGIPLRLPQKVRSSVKRPLMDGNGLLVHIRKTRNELAHGFASFADCGRDRTVRDLRNWRVIVVRYLRAVIRCFGKYLARAGFKRTHDALADRAS